MATGKENVSVLEAGRGNEILSNWIDPSYIDRMKARNGAVIDRLPDQARPSLAWDNTDIGSVSVDNSDMCKAEQSCSSAREEIVYSKKYQIPLSMVTYRDNAVAGGIYVESLNVKEQ